MSRQGDANDIMAPFDAMSDAVSGLEDGESDSSTESSSLWEYTPMKFTEDTTVSRVPMEVWEQIFDDLWDEPAALVACRLVCKAWHTRCQYLLDELASSGKGHLDSSARVQHLARLVRAIPGYKLGVSSIVIQGSGATKETERGTLAHLATFVAMLAHHLSRLERLEICNAEWTKGSIPPSMFLHLSTYHSVAYLGLGDVEFPSIPTFGRFICSFQSLKNLRLWRPSFAHGELPKPFKRRWKIPPFLHVIDVESVPLSRTAEAEIRILRALAATKVAANCREIAFRGLNLWSSPPEYEFWDSSMRQLLSLAGSSLRELRLQTCSPTALEIYDTPKSVDRQYNLDCNTGLTLFILHVALTNKISHPNYYDWIPRLFERIASATLEKPHGPLLQLLRTSKSSGKRQNVLSRHRITLLTEAICARSSQAHSLRTTKDVMVYRTVGMVMLKQGGHHMFLSLLLFSRTVWMSSDDADGPPLHDVPWIEDIDIYHFGLATEWFIDVWAATKPFRRSRVIRKAVAHGYFEATRIKQSMLPYEPM
ncbi:hypothetical protein WOLCODRAFT_146973 [Wolfiporia cocos MD-104 SS10]|uniref:F-box domain-containing protein n=1 Tax=Wolfiporia cocos (strain MD-104) TaxID=742152 RepID=A0A2H3JBC7_WOLCO|nr:hypothetical protein WOLCODRAFT_146973 [Wolfiporia cocos MD-104 SS10]